MDNRGISGVVTAILLILLAIAAVIIVWSVVKPLIEKPAEGAQTDCVTVDLSITSATNIPAGAQKVVVKRKPGTGALTGITVVTYSATDSKTCKVISSLAELASKEVTSADCATGGSFVSGVWTKVEAYAMVGSQNTLCSNFASTSAITAA